MSKTPRKQKPIFTKPRKKTPVAAIAVVAVMVLIIGAAIALLAGRGDSPTGDLANQTTTVPNTTQPDPAEAPIPKGTRSVPEGPDMHSLLVDPKDPDHLFYGNHNGLSESRNGGVKWQPIPSLVRQDAMALDISKEQIWVAGHDVLFSGSMLEGSFELKKTDLPGTDIHGFAVSSSEPETMYAFVVGYGLHRSTDGGNKWSLVSETTQNMGVHGLAVDRADSETIYAIEMQTGLIRSTDGGQNWGTTKLPVPAMSVATGEDGLILAGTEQGTYLSTDNGSTWAQTSKTPTAIVALSPGKDGVAYAIDHEGRISRSADGGSSWK